jgi:integrase
MRIVQQLLTAGHVPTFGPPKTGRPRTVSLGAETVELLRAHKKHQAEIKMANRTTYHDLGLVFAKDWPDLHRAGDKIGSPFQMSSLGQREYNKLVKAANIPRIKFHGLRHTCATLLLQAGQPVHVVSERARALKGDDDPRNLRARPARHAEGRRLDALGTAPRRPLAIR